MYSVIENVLYRFIIPLEISHAWNPAIGPFCVLLSVSVYKSSMCVVGRECMCVRMCVFVYVSFLVLVCIHCIFSSYYCLKRIIFN